MLIFNIENTHTYVTTDNDDWSGLEIIINSLSYRVKDSHFADICKKIWCGRQIGNNMQCRKKLSLIRDSNKRIVQRECKYHGIIPPEEAIALWDGKNCLYNKKNNCFPTGLISRVLETLKEYNITRRAVSFPIISYKIKDQRIKPILGKPYELNNVKLRPYQSRVIEAMEKAGRGQIVLCTRGGKSVITVGWIAKYNVPTLIVVPRLTLLEQLKDDLEDWLGISIGVVGDGEKNPQRITLATYQSIASAYKIRKPRKSKKGTKTTKKPKKISKKKIEEDLENQLVREVVANVETLIVDEYQFASAESLQNIQKNAQKAYYRFGLSGTLSFEDDGDIGRELLCQAYTGKKLIDIRPSELIKDSWLSRPTIYIKPIEYTDELKLLAENIGDVKDEESECYVDFYTKAIVDNTNRNMIICNDALERVQKGKSVLLAVQRKEHGTNLLNILQPILGDKVRYVNGDDKTEYLKQTLADLRANKITCCIATSVFGIGITVNNLDVLINAKATKARTDVVQLTGRALGITETKKTCEIIDYYDNIKLLEKSSKARILLYEEEKEYKIVYK